MSGEAAEVHLGPDGRLSIRFEGGLSLEGIAAGAEVVEDSADAAEAALAGPSWLGAAARAEAARASTTLWRSFRRDALGAGGLLSRALAGAEPGPAGAGDSPDPPSARALLLSPESTGPLALALAVEERDGLVTLRCALENRGGRPVAVRRLFPLALAGGPRRGGLFVRDGRGEPRCALADPDPRARLLRLGWSVAVPPLPLGPRDRDDAAITPPLGLRLSPQPLLDMGFDPAGMPERAPGRAVSAHATVIRPWPGGPSLAAGFSRERRQAGRIRIALGGRGGGSLICESDPDGAVLAPGEAIAGEALHLVAAAHPHDALARWADEAGRRAGARPRPLRYWCTWYAAPCDRIDEAFVATSAAALAARRAPLDALVVDDGWQRDLGDWLETNARFPRGLASLAATVREAGFRPGIWLAPFAVGPGSRVFAEHPEWVVRDARGRPRPAGWVAKIGLPRPYYALDATREDVRAHLERVAASLVRAGFLVLKVDFLTAGALAGRRADPAATRARAYALGMEALRRGAGDAVLVGAIAPFAWNAGWVEGQRVGSDVAFGPPTWSTPLARLGDWTSPSVRNALPGMLALSALDGRLFANDGDCIVARGLSRGLARALALANLATSSVTAVGDDPRRADPDALALLEEIGAFRGPRAGGGRALDLLDRPIPSIVETREGRVFRMRWSAKGGVSRGCPPSSKK